MGEQEPVYLVGNVRLNASDPRLQQLLAAAYTRNTPPLCLCRPNGVPMYIARYKEFVVKRLPESGKDHHPKCSSFDQAPAESGLGEILGDAVIERSPDRVEVRLGFSLTRRVGRPFPAEDPHRPKTEVTATRRSIGLRGLVHLLFQRAGLNNWYPRMQGKRSWYVVRRYLHEAAVEIEAKGHRLADLLYLPEPAQPDDVEGIVRRRARAFAKLLAPAEGIQFRLMLVLGELKDFSPTEIDHRVLLKHMPDCPLYMERKAGDRFKKMFEPEYEAWEHQRSAERAGDAAATRLRFLFVGLVYAKREGVYVVDTASLQLTSMTWVPLDHPYEQQLVDLLTLQQRRFLKPLRYESRQGASFPNAVLLDAGEHEVALDIVSPFMPEKERIAKEHAIGERSPPGWVWQMQSGEELPVLPAVNITTPAPQTVQGA